MHSYLSTRLNALHLPSWKMFLLLPKLRKTRGRWRYSELQFRRCRRAGSLGGVRGGWCRRGGCCGGRALTSSLIAVWAGGREAATSTPGTARGELSGPAARQNPVTAQEVERGYCLKEPSSWALYFFSLEFLTMQLMVLINYFWGLPEKLVRLDMKALQHIASLVVDRVEARVC